MKPWIATPDATFPPFTAKGTVLFLAKSFAQLRNNLRVVSKENKTVSSPQKPVLRPNTGNRLRLRAKTARLRFVETDVTPEEHSQIVTYCLKHKVSVSEFL